MTTSSKNFNNLLLQNECGYKDPVCAGFSRCGKQNKGKSSAQCEILCATGKCPLTQVKE